MKWTGRTARPDAKAFQALGANALLLGLAVFMVIPLWWIVTTSLRPAAEIYSSDQTLLPSVVTIDNYVELLTQTKFTGALVNSVIVAAVVTIGGTLFAGLSGYAFAKFRFPGRDVIFIILIASMTVPGAVTLLPNFILLSRIGLLDTLWAVILPQVALPFAMLWMRQYVRTAVPDSVLEAARVDGAGPYRTFFSIVAPIIRPGLAGVGVWLFLGAWNSLLIPLVYLSSNENYTYPVFLSALQGNPTLQVTHLVMAAAVLATLPVVVVFLALQRHFVASAAMSIDQG